MSRWRVKQSDYIITSPVKKKVNDEVQERLDEIDAKYKAEKDMFSGAKKLGCKKQFPDCPDTLNGVDCFSCPFFPKQFKANPNVYSVHKKQENNYGKSQSKSLFKK